MTPSPERGTSESRQSTEPLRPDPRRRAAALLPSDRREHIVEAVVPLLAVYGNEITTRQIAEAAGVAEGTIFRAFGDKESVLRAAAARFFDPETVRRGLDDIDPQDELTVKIAQIVEVLSSRLAGALKVMSAVGYERPPQGEHDVLEACVKRIFAPEVSSLAWTPRRVVHLLRLLSFASSIPEVNQGERAFDAHELAEIVVNGILAPPPVTADGRARIIEGAS